jgi:hypothetical protein
MAITKTVFSGTTAATNAAEVTAWLQANATDLFESVTNEANIITCTVSGGGQLIIKPNVREWTAVLSNGTSNTIDHYNNSNKVTEAYATSKGIALYSESNMWIFVVKSNNNSIGIVFTENANKNYYFADFANSVSFKSDPNNIKHTQMGMTSLCACPLGNGGTYGDGLYFVPFYEYSNQAILSVQGTSYVYDGWFALEE